MYMALFASSVLLLLGFIQWATIGYMSSQIDETIEAEIKGLSEQYERRGLVGLRNVIRSRVEEEPNASAIYLFTTASLKRIAGNIVVWPKEEKISPDGWLEFELTERSQRKAQTHTARARVFMLAGQRRLLVGRDIKELEAFKSLMLRAMSWGLAMTLCLALVGGIMMSTSMLRRIEAINQTSRDIMTGDLSRRIPTLGTGDDFDKLAANLNAMLDQIEHLMAGIRHVSDNIAHDLKSPLTRMRNRLEQMQFIPDNAESHQQKVSAIIVEADHLLATFNALLRISRIESGGQGNVEVCLDLAHLVGDAVEFYEALAEEKQQTLTLNLKTPLNILADRDLLFQALANLLDNAIKYTPEKGHIHVLLEQKEQQAVLSVIDNGEGIPAAERDHVLQRFYRLERSRSTPGNGLGLSLVSAVIALHHADIDLADNPNGQGLCVCLCFPLHIV
jgi:signal transduction histidine kinase